jgi:hypothetical protein
MSSSVNIVAWAANHGINSEAAKELQRLAHAAFNAEDRDASQAVVDSKARAFERFAKTHGLTVTWPGLWPVLHRGNEEIHLPE